MKRLRQALVAAAAVVLAAAGLLVWILRPHPRPRLEEAAGAAFSVQPVQVGWILQHLDEQIPLRAIRWVPVQGTEHLVAQVLTQSDQQWVFLFGPGKPLGSWKLERAAGTEEGFFRFAELKDACLTAEGSLFLLYGPGAGAAAEGLLVALALGSEQATWSLRLEGSRLSPVPEAPALLAWGSPSVVHRVPLGGTRGKPPRPTRIELPAELKEPSDLLPLGRERFAVAHRHGLAVFAGAEGWVHHPAPQRPAWPTWPGARGRLAAEGGTRWWQPCPGLLWELAADGRPVREVGLTLEPAEGSPRDHSMLTLLGCEPGGDLWFGLSEPSLTLAVPPVNLPAAAGPEAPATPEPAPADAAKAAPAPAELNPREGTDPPVEEVEAWQRHLATGLGRIYRRPAEGGTLRRFDWARLWTRWPEAAGFPRPTGDAGLRPDCGFVVIGAERRVWWLPLAALAEPAAAKPGNRTGSGG